MYKKYLNLLVLSAAIFSLILVATTNTSFTYAQNEKFRARLDGNNEVPPLEINATGPINFKTKGDMMTWKLVVTGMKDAQAANIHKGKTGENGDIIVELFTSDKPAKHKETLTGMIIRGNITNSDLKGVMEGKTLEDLRSEMSTGDTYVNLGTEDHPDGAIRGQINMKLSNVSDTSVSDTDTSASDTNSTDSN